MKRITRKSRLSLHKESLKALTRADLAAAAGASGNAVCTLSPKINLSPLLTPKLTVLPPTTNSLTLCPFPGCKG